ncbi:S-adenosylmethionine decarboxylase [Patescibacteria group bacterium]|nr:S-adenosylmethionine decarboxylase [Patescibacteria group bacterium]
MSFFGLHIILDCYGGNNALFCDTEAITEYQLEATRLCGMNVLFGPHNLVAKPVSEKDRGGVTGVTVISESHIAIHTFDERGFVMIDIATCKTDIPVDAIVAFTQEFFGFAEVEVTVVERGKKFGEYNPTI